MLVKADKKTAAMDPINYQLLLQQEEFQSCNNSKVAAANKILRGLLDQQIMSGLTVVDNANACHTLISLKQMAETQLILCKSSEELEGVKLQISKACDSLTRHAT